MTMKKLLLALAVILGLLLSLSLASCARTVSIELPFEPADLDKVEMFRFQNPAEAEKKVITDPADVKDLCGLLESISLKDKKTEPVAPTWEPAGTTTTIRSQTQLRVNCQRSTELPGAVKTGCPFPARRKHHEETALWHDAVLFRFPFSRHAVGRFHGQ